MSSYHNTHNPPADSLRNGYSTAEKKKKRRQSVGHSINKSIERIDQGRTQSKQKGYLAT